MISGNLRLSDCYLRALVACQPLERFKTQGSLYLTLMVCNPQMGTMIQILITRNLTHVAILEQIF